MTSPPPSIEPTSGPRRIRRRLGLRWVLLIAAVLVVAIVIVLRLRSGAGRPAQQKPGIAAQARKVPVVAVEARRGNIPIYVTGLGSVTPVNTVTVRTRVDGLLLRVLYKEGQFVDAGDLLAEIDPRPFEAQVTLYEGQLARDLANLANAQRDLRRFRTLTRQDSIARQQYDTQRALVSQLQGSIRADQGNVDNARIQLGYTRIVAPVSGRVGLRLVDPGNIVHATDANGLVVITQLEPMTVIFSIAEDSLPPVLDAMRAGERLQVDAFNRELTRLISSGVLASIDNAIDPTTGTVKLRAEFENRQHELFPNQFVNARLLVAYQRDTTVVPTPAIQRGPQGTFVYVIKSDQTAETRPVKTGVSEGDQSSVQSGIAPGELVVVDGADRLRPGAKVELRAQGGTGGQGGSAADGGTGEQGGRHDGGAPGR